MSYIFYNPNPRGRFVGDCVIRAVCKVTHQDWRTVHADLADLSKSLVDAVKNNGIFDKVSWISFNASWLTYVKNYASEARIGYLTDTLTTEKITTAQGFLTGSNEVFINTSALSAEAVRICKEANLPMEVYTIDSANQIRELNPYITGVTSNNLIAGKILYNSNIQ